MPNASKNSPLLTKFFGCAIIILALAMCCTCLVYAVYFMNSSGVELHHTSLFILFKVRKNQQRKSDLHILKDNPKSWTKLLRQLSRMYAYFQFNLLCYLLLPFLSTFPISRLSKRFFSTSMMSGSNNFRSGLFRGLVNESSQQFFSRDF